MCNMSKDDKDYQELLNRISDIDNNIIKLNFEMGSYKEDMSVVKESMEKLVIYIERTRENDDKIRILFSKLNKIENEGTKNCPVSIEKINRLKERIDRLDRYLVYAMLTIIFQLLILLLHFLDPRIPL